MALGGSKIIATCQRWWRTLRRRIKIAIKRRRKQSQTSESCSTSKESDKILEKTPPALDQKPNLSLDKASTDTSSTTVTPFKWGKLPTELQLEIIEVLAAESKQDRAANQPHLLLHLSSTCKQLRSVCAPHVYSKFQAPNPDEELWSEFIIATSYLGKYLSGLTLEIYYIHGPPPEEPSPEEVEKERQLHDVIANLPLISDLHLIFHRFDQRKHLRFLEALAGMKKLRHLAIMERGLEPDISFDDADDSLLEMLFFNDLLHHVLDHQGPTLESLKVSSALKFHAQVFHKLRENARSLKRLSLVHSIALKMRSEFAREIPWACAGTLEQLTFHHCMGVHFGWFARNIGKGIVFGNKLKRVDLVVCGYPDDDERAPAEWLVRHDRVGKDEATGREIVKSQWRTSGSVSDAGPVHGLDSLRIDHTIDWELAKMGSLPVRDLIITRCTRDIVLNIFKNAPSANDTTEDYQGFKVGGNIPFPGLQVLHLANYEAVEDEELSVRCAERGIMVKKDGKAWDSCTCHKDG